MDVSSGGSRAAARSPVRSCNSQDHCDHGVRRTPRSRLISRHRSEPLRGRDHHNAAVRSEVHDVTSNYSPQECYTPQKALAPNVADWAPRPGRETVEDWLRATSHDGDVAISDEEDEGIGRNLSRRKAVIPDWSTLRGNVVCRIQEANAPLQRFHADLERLQMGRASNRLCHQNL